MPLEEVRMGICRRLIVWTFLLGVLCGAAVVTGLVVGFFCLGMHVANKDSVIGKAPYT